MCKMKGLLIFAAVALIIHDATAAMSEKQLKAAVKLLRNMCQPKTKATNEDIDKMHAGNWNIDHNAMCYMHCTLSMYKLIGSDNRFDYESAMNQMKQIPDAMKEYVQRCIDQCRDSAITVDDKCMAAYEMSKCMYFCSPEDYFLP